MKIKFTPRIAAALLALATVNFLLPSAFAQGTAFTYQGQLQNNGSPVSGTYNLTFTLFNTNSGGEAVAGPVTNNAVVVNDGLFTAVINFGSGVFTGATNWMQIGVESNGVANFTTLTPRQQLTPTPYAVYSESGGSAQSLANGTSLGQGSGNSISTSGATDSFIGGGTQNQILFSSLYAAIDGGQNNIIEPNAGWSVVAGGEGNVTYSGWSVISGGNGNQVGSGTSGSTIGGGWFNTNSANFATLAGGQSNVVSGVGATVAGGVQNTASGFNATVGGGGQNIASGDYSTVSGGGGCGNTTGGNGCTVSGGSCNTAMGNSDTVGGGYGNQAVGGYSTVAGGADNITSGGFATAAGGNNNNADGNGSSIGGGGYDGTTFSGNSANGDASAIGGGLGNTASAIYATVGGGVNNNAGGGGSGGGGAGGAATVSGGNNNFADGANATVSGGQNNTATANFSTVSGGQGNTASGQNAAVGGGLNNTASGFAAAVVGGSGNNVTAGYSTIGGGYDNTASGGDSFAAGVYAQAVNNNTFVWSDGSGITTSTTANQFMARASGGIIFYSGSGTPNYIITIGGTATPGDTVIITLFDDGTTVSVTYTVQNGDTLVNIAAGLESKINTVFTSVNPSINASFSGPVITVNGLGPKTELTGSTSPNATETVSLSGGTATGVSLPPGSGMWTPLSDRNAKTNFQPVNPETVLAKIADMPITTWNYKTQDPSIRHLGPMAQDFRAAFGLGEDDKHIGTLDEEGVGLAAIQGLNQKLEETRAENAELKQQNNSLAERLNELEAAVKQLAKQK